MVLLGKNVHGDEIHDDCDGSRQRRRDDALLGTLVSSGNPAGRWSDDDYKTVEELLRCRLEAAVESLTTIRDRLAGHPEARLDHSPVQFCLQQAEAAVQAVSDAIPPAAPVRPMRRM